MRNRLTPLYKTPVTKIRQATWRFRQSPDFIILGAQKSGTTSLFSYLAQHPGIHPSFKKEVHYFDGGLNPREDTFAKGDAWYRSHFPMKWSLTQNSKTFEASPLYLFHPLVPARIAQNFPDAKLIAILRNPVDRAISHYFHEKKNGSESLTMMQAFEAEEARLQLALDTENYNDPAFNRYSYKMRGVYHTQLQRYYKFFPRENILLINSESLFTDPNNTLNDINRFIGVTDNYSYDDLQPKNVNAFKTKIDQSIYQYLNNYFQPHNEKLFALTGEIYNW